MTNPWRLTTPVETKDFKRKRTAIFYAWQVWHLTLEEVLELRRAGSRTVRTGDNAIVLTLREKNHDENEDG